MIRTGHGRPLRAIGLAALVLLALVPPAPAAAATYGNVVSATLPVPDANDVVLARLQVDMGMRRGARGGLGRLAVRRVSALPFGFDVAAVRARPRAGRVTIRLVAVRTSRRAFRRTAPLRVRLRIGDRRVVYRRATTYTVAIGPRSDVRGTPGCSTIAGEAARWIPARGLGAIAFGSERFSARTAVGAAQQIACRRRIPSVSRAAAAGFLNAVDARFAGGPAGAVEGFYATWVRDGAGNAKICVYTRGEPSGTGDVTIAGTTYAFRLDPSSGVARVDAPVPGPGEYPFLVRWRQPDGTYRESESALRVPAGGGRGDDPPQPYAAAGPCA